MVPHRVVHVLPVQPKIVPKTAFSNYQNEGSGLYCFRVVIQLHCESVSHTQITR